MNFVIFIRFILCTITTAVTQIYIIDELFYTIPQFFHTKTANFHQLHIFSFSLYYNVAVDKKVVVSQSNK